LDLPSRHSAGRIKSPSRNIQAKTAFPVADRHAADFTTLFNRRMVLLVIFIGTDLFPTNGTMRDSKRSLDNAVGCRIHTSLPLPLFNDKFGVSVAAAAASG